jgi:hypothetical protein
LPALLLLQVGFLLGLLKGPRAETMLMYWELYLRDPPTGSQTRCGCCATLFGVASHCPNPVILLGKIRTNNPPCSLGSKHCPRTHLNDINRSLHNVHLTSDVQTHSYWSLSDSNNSLQYSLEESPARVLSGAVNPASRGPFPHEVRPLREDYHFWHIVHPAVVEEEATVGSSGHYTQADADKSIS